MPIGLRYGEEPTREMGLIFDWRDFWRYSFISIIPRADRMSYLREVSRVFTRFLKVISCLFANYEEFFNPTKHDVMDRIRHQQKSQ